MSGLENLNLGDLGLSFPTAEALAGEQEETASAGFFGPSTAQLNKFEAWEGCDGKLFLPYNNREKIGKISDFVSAAIQAAKDKERELDKNEFQKRKDAEQAAYKQEKKAKAAKAKEETKVRKEEEEPEDDDMGFTTIEESRNMKTKNNTKQQNPWQNNRGRGGWQQRGGRGGAQAGREKGYGVANQQLKARSKKDKSRENWVQSNYISNR